MNKYYIHHVPGRLRIETPFFIDASDYAGKIEGVNAVKVIAATSAVIINYNPEKASWQVIIKEIEKKGWFKLSEAVTLDECLKSDITKILNVGLEIAEEVL